MSCLSSTWTDVNQGQFWGISRDLLVWYVSTLRPLGSLIHHCQNLNAELSEFTVYPLNSQINYCNGWRRNFFLFVLDCRLCAWNHLNLKDMALLAPCCPALPSPALPARQPFPARGGCCCGGSERLEVFWESSRAIISLACEENFTWRAQGTKG